MGEANPHAIALITSLTGHAPVSCTHPDGTQFLRIGNIVITATEFALWSDPSVFLNSDSMFTLSWGGHNAEFYKDEQGNWTADVHRDLLSGKARRVT